MKFTPSMIAAALAALISRTFESRCNKLFPIGYEDEAGFHFGNPKGLNSSASGTSSGRFSGFDVVLYQMPVQNSSVKRTLCFSTVIAEKVTITFAGGAPGLTTFVFGTRIAL